MIQEYKRSLRPLIVEVSYAYCLSPFLMKKLDCSRQNVTHQNQKYVIWNELFEENKIEIFDGTDENYIVKLNTWIHKLE